VQWSCPGPCLTKPIDWLSKMRARYAELEKILDEKVLTLPEPGNQPIYITPRYDYGPRRLTLPLSAWQFHVDERLEWLPSYSEEPSNTLFIEWVYTIDLDREIVHIKSQSAEISFELSSTPHELEWPQDFDEEEEEKEAEGEGTPPPAKTAKGQAFAALLVPAAPSKSLVRRCDSLRLTKVKPRRLARLNSSREHSYSIRELLFTLFVKKWRCRFSKHILLCRPVDFIYREVVFAILSLASGEFKLLADQTPLQDRGQHTADRLGRPNGPSVLPDFGSGVHVSNIRPGSAPDSSIYWFKGILVMLAEELVHDDGYKGAIVKVIEFGQVSGLKTFDALITNIQTFMLVRITDDVLVQHTELIKLVNYTALSGSETESSDGSKAYEEFIPVRGDTGGFDILMNFFDVVAAYTLKPFKSTSKGLPNELYDRIIETADSDTYLKCSDVSDNFQHYVQQHIRLSQQSGLTSIPHQNATFEHHVIKGVSSTTSQLIIFDTVEGQDVESDVRPWSERNFEPFWAPVIGHDQRQSMIVECGITVPALDYHLLPVAEDHHPGIDDLDFASLIAAGDPFGSQLQMFGFEHFYIPKFSGARDVSLAWESYLRLTLMKSSATGQEVPWKASPEAHLFLLPPNAGSISLKPYKKLLRDANGKRYSEIAGMIWLKKPADFEVTRVRQRTLSEAQDYLNSMIVEQGVDSKPVRQGLLVVAFGAKAQCFEWDFAEDTADVQPAMKQLADGAVLDVAVKDQRERFEGLFGTFRDKAEAARVAADVPEK
jgi:hypothetical protein